MRAYRPTSWRGPRRAPGPQPGGGLVGDAILACLLAQAITGLFVSDEVLFDGPFLRAVSEGDCTPSEHLHGINFNILLLLEIGLHLAAITFYRFVKREDLVRPMLSGFKWVPIDLTGRDAPRGGSGARRGAGMRRRHRVRGVSLARAGVGEGRRGVSPPPGGRRFNPVEGPPRAEKLCRGRRSHQTAAGRRSHTRGGYSL